jgi:hypothetical protein
MLELSQELTTEFVHPGSCRYINCRIVFFEKDP